MVRNKTRFITASDLMLQLAAAKAQGQLKEYFNRAVLGPKLLVIDEIGYLPVGREEATQLLYQLPLQQLPLRRTRAAATGQPHGP